MNMEMPKKLAGAIKPGNIPAGFCVPVYSAGQDYFIREPEGEGRLPSFKKINDDVVDLIEYVGEQKYSCESETLYAFLNQDGSVHYDGKYGMTQYLRKKIEELDDYVFVKLEVLEFLEDIDAVPPVVIEAASLMLEDNPKGAIAWSKMQSVKAATAISHKIEKRKDVIGRFSRAVGSLGRKLADRFQRLEADDLDSNEFEHCYIDVADWHQRKSTTQLLVVGREGSGKSSLLRIAKLRDRFSDLVIIEPNIVHNVTSINNYYEKTEEATSLKSERIWHGVIAGIICQKVIGSDRWAELASSPIFSERTKLKCGTDTPDYIKSMVDMIGAKDPLVSIFIKRALCSHSSSENFLVSEFEHIIASNLENRSRRLMLIIDGIEGVRPHSAINNSMQGIANYLLRRTVEQSNYAFITSLAPQSYFFLIEKNPNALRLAQNTFNITWKASELCQMIFRRVALVRNEGRIQETQKYFSNEDFNLLRSAFLPTVFNAKLKIHESGLNYIIRHTQLLPRQLLYILSKLYGNSTTSLDAGILPSKSDIDAAIYEASPLLARAAVQEVTDNHGEFLHALEFLISRVGSIFKFSDVAKAWDKETCLNQYFASPMQTCEQLAKVGAIGRVVKRYESYTTASFSVPLGELFSENDAQYCFHPLFATAVKRTGTHGGTSDEKIIPVDYFESSDSMQIH